MGRDQILLIPGEDKPRKADYDTASAMQDVNTDNNLELDYFDQFFRDYLVVR